MIGKWTVYIIVVFFLSSCDRSGRKPQAENRPQVHFSAGSNWTGQPSGFVFFNDNYHLFYEYNPNEPFDGDNSWGHAVSRDLVNWQKLPLAISPDRQGSINPGSVVADVGNTSQLGSPGNTALIAFYTCDNPEKELAKAKPERGVCLAFSLDEGMSWTKKPEPVITTRQFPVFRNPNVKWNELIGQWLMTVSIGSAIQFYSSPDCVNWSLLSEFGESVENLGYCESSDFFPLTADDFEKWVLMVSTGNGPSGNAPAVRYFVGDFDGFEFHVTQHQELWVDYGRDNYGAMTCNNSQDDRKLMIGWMNNRLYANQTPQIGGRGSMVIPRELELVKEGSFYLLSSFPVEEVQRRYQEEHLVSPMTFEGSEHILKGHPFPETPFLLHLRFDNSNRYAIWGPRSFGVRFRTKTGKSFTIGYNSEMKYFYIDRSKLPETAFSGEFEQIMGASYTMADSVSDWNILVDEHSVELFACGNKIAMTSLFYADEKFSSIELYSDSGNTTLIEGAVGQLTGAGKSTQPDVFSQQKN